MCSKILSTFESWYSWNSRKCFRDQKPGDTSSEQKSSRLMSETSPQDSGRSSYPRTQNIWPHSKRHGVGTASMSYNIESALDLRNSRRQWIEFLKAPRVSSVTSTTSWYMVQYTMSTGRRLNVVLPQQTAANVTLSTGKCTFSVTKILFLCHVISADDIEADSEKIAASTNLSQPRNIQEFRSFLGIVNQLSKFTNHLADQTKPLIELLQNDCNWIWIWGPAQAKAFWGNQNCIDDNACSCLVLTKQLYKDNCRRLVIRVCVRVCVWGGGGILMQNCSFSLPKTHSINQKPSMAT